ncbi:MAG: T9SS type A sorting domain-containing protein [bacterium]
MKVVTVFFVTVVMATMLFATGIDYSNGEYSITTNQQAAPQIVVPENFDVEQATVQMNLARENEDIETANQLSLQIHQWWLDNREMEIDPSTHDLDGNSTSKEILPQGENNKQPLDYAPLWGDDVRIDPRDGVRGAQVVSLSNGELYAISIQYSGGDYTRITSRSTDGGQTWAVCDEWNASPSNIYEARLSVADDTLIMSYILENTSGQYQAWTKVVEPGPGPTLPTIHFGSPSGGYIDNIIYDFMVTNDGANYTSKWVYATWMEANTSGTDTTRIRFARSNNLDVSSWDINDTIAITAGDNIYFDQNQLENGNATNLVLAVRLHPYNYPTSYDEYIRGYLSTSGGSSWSSFFYITPSNNHMDEYQPALAGSHDNNNYVCLVTQEDTLSPTDRNIINYYSVDNGTTWVDAAWVSPDTNFLPYAMVDYNSTAFFAVFRKNLANGDEQVRFKQGDINNPNSWTQSADGIVNDNQDNLSDSYGPTVCYDYSPDGVCVAWTDYMSATYSVWFDNMSWTTGVEEEPVVGDLNAEAFSVVQNGKTFRINYSVTTPGNVSINIFDISGRNVSNLLNERKEAGTYSLDYEPDFSSGSYFFTIQTNQGIQTRQTFFVK